MIVIILIIWKLHLDGSFFLNKRKRYKPGTPTWKNIERERERERGGKESKNSVLSVRLDDDDDDD